MVEEEEDTSVSVVRLGNTGVAVFLILRRIIGNDRRSGRGGERLNGLLYGQQQQEHRYNFKASLVYVAGFRPVRATLRPCLKHKVKLDMPT